MAAKVALVTGCSSGFGLLASVSLARHGFSVVATMRTLGKRGRLDEALAAAGATATVLSLDVTSPESIGEAVARTEADVGPVSVLVNNAGYGVGGFVHDLTLPEIREQLETNFFGAVAMVKAVLPGMLSRGEGRIVNVSSIAGHLALPAMAAYSASKWAMEAFSESLRTEVRPFGLWVSLVEPGTFRTDIFDGNRRVAAAGRDPSSPYVRMSERMERIVDEMLRKNRQDPQWVADAIVRAATARRPRLRYLVGTDARAQALLKRLLPWPVLEWAILRQTQLSRYR
jgi:NAD(P)-dependent dehydrogenase (short-subunit alcohol dehydrogenase family)